MKKKKILIIDDDALSRMFFRTTLEQAGYKIMEAENAKKAMDFQRGYPADLVIIDIKMPEKKRLETIIAFRIEFPATEIIAVLDGESLKAEDSGRRAAELGAHWVVSKPCTRKDALEAVQKLMCNNQDLHE